MTMNGAKTVPKPSPSRIWIIKEMSRTIGDLRKISRRRELTMSPEKDDHSEESLTANSAVNRSHGENDRLQWFKVWNSAIIIPQAECDILKGH